jgi:hypothetical protein
MPADTYPYSGKQYFTPIIYRMKDKTALKNPIMITCDRLENDTIFFTH